ncbi:MAG: TonB-dependent receptor [Candidatus Marinimicrobia bacterium]|nr:TonB-dependent receptor [Candidatus Neomarinimicrobiota bacterium]MCF7904625.1 TonB-dependent receptor [Candidatus Neomarinimicrobiota bacterium]
MISFRNYQTPILWMALLVLLPSAFIFGQQVSSITGRVTDAKTGEGLPGVNIIIKKTSMGTTSDLEGGFTLDKLAPGSYDLSFSMMGYGPHTEKNIQLAAGVPTVLDVKLRTNILSSPHVVVTSSRKEQDILESPFTVSAIGPREIQSKGVVNLVEAISHEAGVSTVKGQLNIRGTSGYTMGAGSRSLLLLDGVPMLGSAGGNITWGIVPTSEVDRVEIVKSGGSAMYGSSSMGGVVNIITRNAPLAPETRVSSQVGVYSHPRVEQWRWRDQRGLIYNTEFSHSRRIGNHAAWLRIQHRHDEGFMELNWEKAINVTGKVKFNFGNAHSAAVFLNVLDDEYGLTSVWKSSANPFEAPAGSENDKTAGVKKVLNAHYNYIHSQDLIIKTKGSAYTNRWENSGVDPDYSNESRFYEEVQASKRWSDKLTSILGVTMQQNTVDAQIFGQHNSSSLASFLLLEQGFHQFTLSAGSRWEAYKVDGADQDQVLAPQIALNWKPAPWLAFRVSTGKGFRVPTVAEMFTSARRSIFTVEPNPDLISETSVNRELGIAIFTGQMGSLDLLKLDVAVFHNRFENFIEPIPDSLAVIRFYNIADARIRGAEVGSSISMFDNLIDYKSAFTWMDPVELNDEGEVVDTLSYRHRYHWISTLGAHYWGLDAAVEYRYSSRMESVELFDENGLTGQDVRVPIHVVNAGVGTNIGTWNFLFRVENIFQYYYTELERNIAEERVFKFKVEKAF